MEVLFTPSGGRFGHGFDYWCSECQVFVGNSVDSAELTHPSVVMDESGWRLWARKTSKPSTCKNAGKVCSLPVHIINAPEVK